MKPKAKILEYTGNPLVDTAIENARLDALKKINFLHNEMQRNYHKEYQEIWNEFVDFTTNYASREEMSKKCTPNSFKKSMDKYNAECDVFTKKLDKAKKMMSERNSEWQYKTYCEASELYQQLTHLYGVTKNIRRHTRIFIKGGYLNGYNLTFDFSNAHEQLPEISYTDLL
jgi:hypothetical protein